MRLTVKAINEELAKRGYGARLEKGDSYFYFSGGEAADWLDRTVSATNLSTLTLEQWVDEFERLKNLNSNILRVPGQKDPGQTPRPSSKRQRRHR